MKWQGCQAEQSCRHGWIDCSSAGYIRGAARENLRAPGRAIAARLITSQSRRGFLAEKLAENTVLADTPIKNDGSKVLGQEHGRLFCGALLF
jgi:hypothetical protein